MRRPTTILIFVAIVVVAVALVLRSGDDTTPDAGGSTTTTSGETTSSTAADGDTSSTTTPSTTTTTIALPAGEFCDVYGEIVETGVVQSQDLVEASGLAASRTTPGVMWSHNDSRGGPNLFALDPTGADLGAFTVPDAFALDWEDIGAGPDENGEGAYLYVGDMGDNFGIRDGLVGVFRVPDLDPATLDGAFPESRPIALLMPDGPHDAEALFVDPIDPAIYIVTKSRDEAFVFRGPLTSASQPQEMELVATLFLGGEVSGGDISPDGRVIALRGYSTVWVWTRTEGQTVAEALQQPPCTAPSPDERQGESITLTPDWSYFTISEGTNPIVNQVPAQTP